MNDWLLIETFKLLIEWTPQKDNMYCIYSKGEFIFEKKKLPWGTPTDTQERFISLEIKYNQ